MADEVEKFDPNAYEKLCEDFDAKFSDGPIPLGLVQDDSLSEPIEETPNYGDLDTLIKEALGEDSGLPGLDNTTFEPTGFGKWIFKK